MLKAKYPYPYIRPPENLSVKTQNIIITDTSLLTVKDAIKSASPCPKRHHNAPNKTEQTDPNTFAL